MKDDMEVTMTAGLVKTMSHHEAASVTRLLRDRLPGTCA